MVPEESPELLKRALNEGDILVNSKKANAQVKVTSADKVLIAFGGPPLLRLRNRAEYWAEIYQCWFNTNRTMTTPQPHPHPRNSSNMIPWEPSSAKMYWASRTGALSPLANVPARRN